MKKLISLCVAFMACFLLPLTAFADAVMPGLGGGVPFSDRTPGQIILFCGIGAFAVAAAAAAVIVLINRKKRSGSDSEDNQNRDNNK